MVLIELAQSALLVLARTQTVVVDGARKGMAAGAAAGIVAVAGKPVRDCRTRTVSAAGAQLSETLR